MHRVGEEVRSSFQVGGEVWISVLIIVLAVLLTLIIASKKIIMRVSKESRFCFLMSGDTSIKLLSIPLVISEIHFWRENIGSHYTE